METAKLSPAITLPLNKRTTALSTPGFNWGYGCQIQICFPASLAASSGHMTKVLFGQWDIGRSDTCNLKCLPWTFSPLPAGQESVTRTEPDPRKTLWACSLPLELLNLRKTSILFQPQGVGSLGQGSLLRNPKAYNRYIPTFPDKPRQTPSPLNCLHLLRQLKNQMNVIQLTFILHETIFKEYI